MFYDIESQVDTQNSSAYLGSWYDHHDCIADHPHMHRRWEIMPRICGYNITCITVEWILEMMYLYQGLNYLRIWLGDLPVITCPSNYIWLRINIAESRPTCSATWRQKMPGWSRRSWTSDACSCSGLSYTMRNANCLRIGKKILKIIKSKSSI